MRPVEQTSTCSAATPSPSPVSAAMRRASVRPRSPVAALALPDDSTTAAARPSARWSRLICTGAAQARLVVNTPAAGTAVRSSVATIARSGAPDSLIPHAAPPATNPFAAVTLMRPPSNWHAERALECLFCAPVRGPRCSWPHPDDRQAGGLGQDKQQVGVLHRAARGTLHEVVDDPD